jgi:hypothetical protein
MVHPEMVRRGAAQQIIVIRSPYLQGLDENRTLSEIRQSPNNENQWG